MRAVLDITHLVDKGQGDFMFGCYAYGVFLTEDLEDNVFIAVKDGDKIEKIRLDGANKSLIIGKFDESQERKTREKKMEEIKDMLLRVSERTKKIEDFLNNEKKKADETLDRIVEKYIRETWVGITELKKQRNEDKGKGDLPEDSFKGFISEAALERIIRELKGTNSNKE